METLAKSNIIANIAWAISHSENLEAEYVRKDTGEQIQVKIAIQPRDCFVDEKGVKWVRE